jgi:small subunit ribosomal protein S17
MSTNPSAGPKGDNAPARNQRRLVGRVVSDRMQKTVVVRVDRRVRDAAIGKILTRSKKYHAHVAEGPIREGDLVEIAECRPLSRTKSWTVTRRVAKARVV